MSRSQQPTHKWKPSISKRVLFILKGNKDTPHNLAKKLGETQAAVSVAMYNLWQQGTLKREGCQCGRGFVYYQ